MLFLKVCAKRVDFQIFKRENAIFMHCLIDLLHWYFCGSDFARHNSQREMSWSRIARVVAPTATLPLKPDFRVSAERKDIMSAELERQPLVLGLNVRRDL